MNNNTSPILYFKDISFDMIDSINKSKNNMIIFDYTNSKDVEIIRNNIKILEVDKVLVLPKNIDDFDYVVTTNINTYMMLRTKKSNLGKILCPLLSNINSFNFYCQSAAIKNHFSELAYVSDINKANVILYEHIVELVDLKNDIKDLLIIKYNSSNIKSSITYLKEFNKILHSSAINSYNKIYNYMQTIKINHVYKKVFINYKDNNILLEFKKGHSYTICRKGFNFYRNLQELVEKDISNYIYFLKGKIVSYISDGIQEKEPVLFFTPNEDSKMTFLDLLKRVDFIINILIGRNSIPMEYDEIIEFYYVLGSVENLFGNDYINTLLTKYVDITLAYAKNIIVETNKKYDKDKLIRLLSYWCGQNKDEFSKNKIDDFINKNINLINNEKIAIVSKAINTYGGNQKTSIQLYNTLIKNGYHVDILCIKSFDIVNDIHNNDIKIITIETMIDYINTRNYKLVIVNKLNEYLNINKDIKANDIIITHNSIDPFNKLIDNNVSKVLAVNNSTISTLYEIGAKVPISRYVNYMDTIDYEPCTTKYNKRALFVGRLSKEKNIPMLIEAWKEINKIRNDIELTIVGSGDKEYVVECNNVTYLGQQNFEMIMILLMKTDYLILPSTTEGLSFSILEAMSMGVPIIASDIVGTNEVVIDYKTGFLFKLYGYDEHKYDIDDWHIFNYVDEQFNKNVLSLKNVILKAYECNFEDWKKMSDNCIKLVKSCFSFENSEFNLIKNIEKIKRILIITENIKDINVIVDTTTDINNVNIDLYDIVINNKDINNENIYDILPKLYRLRFECLTKCIYKITDDKSYIIFPDRNINKNNCIKFKNINNMLFC